MNTDPLNQNETEDTVPIAENERPQDHVAEPEAIQAAVGEDRAEEPDQPCGGEDENPPQATRLVHLAEESAVLFHDPDKVGYARIRIHEHRETWKLKSREFSMWLSRQYYNREGKPPNPPAIKSALEVLEAQAVHDNETHTVHIRIAEHRDKFYLDLCNDKWQVVEIGPDGWEVIDESPVRFRRTNGMMTLPCPEQGGSIEALRKFVNVGSSSDFVLVATWLLSTFRTQGPYPILILHGEQGSAKSTAAEVIRGLIDPNKAPIRSEPRDERDLVIAANNSHVIALDNMSHVKQSLSDALCRLATGGGFATREMYSDDQETIFEVQRPVILNGITELATRGDLLDRSIIVCLPRITSTERKAEDEFWADFEEARPRILGALLNAVCMGLRDLGEIELDELPRMADFAKWGAACEPACPWGRVNGGVFLETYVANQEDTNDLALESSLVARAVRMLIEGQADGEWTGTASGLLDALDGICNGDSVKREWPRTPQGLSGALRRLTPNLRRVGIKVTFDRESGKERRRLITIRDISQEGDVGRCRTHEEGGSS